MWRAREHKMGYNTRIHICFVQAEREQQLKELHQDDDRLRSVLLYKRNGIIYASGIILRPAHIHSLDLYKRKAHQINMSFRERSYYNNM